MRNPIEEVASWAEEPKPKQTSSVNGQYSEFDLDSWMARHNLAVRRGPLAWDNRGTKWELETCPFNAEHTGGCAVITRLHTGALGFKCHHNGCSDKNWQALRELYDGPKEQRQQTRSNGAHREQGPHATASPRVVSSGEILQMSLREANFVVEPIITGPGVWLLNGAQKAGKTIFAAQLALSLQASQAFLGWYSIRKSCAALFIEQDDPSGLAALKPILERSTIPIGVDQFVAVENARFTLEPGFVEFLQREITGRHIGLVVLDSYTALRGPRNSNMDIVKAESIDLGMLDALAKKNGCLIVVIHHASKGSAARLPGSQDLVGQDQVYPK